MEASRDVVVVGAGIVGAACAESLTRRGVGVTIIDRAAPMSGTSASGEGNILVSDKEPGPELLLAQASRRRWPRLLAELAEELAPTHADGPRNGGTWPTAEWEDKGGLVVATTPAAATALEAFAAAQRAAQVVAEPLAAAEVAAREPWLTRSVVTAVHYPEDAQVQPVLATAALLAAVRRRGGQVLPGLPATGVELDRSGAVAAVRTARGRLSCGAVVNACGPWSGRFANAAGAPLAIAPRRGMVLVTAPLPKGTVRHKVYDAAYVGAVASGDVDLMTSTVVESTPAGTLLIGSSRQRIGFDDTLRAEVLRELARKAMALFPVLADVPVMRAYGGFRPYAPDHLPVIGEDPRRPGLWHSTGHEGAGIGLAAATGELLAELLTGQPPHLDPVPFRVDRPGLMRQAEHSQPGPGA